jgi:hypothetical protein
MDRGDCWSVFPFSFQIQTLVCPKCGCHPQRRALSTTTKMLRSVWDHSGEPASPVGVQQLNGARSSKLIPKNLDATAFAHAVVCLVDTSSAPPTARYFTGGSTGKWREVAGALDGDEGSAIIHLPGEHPNMYLTNIRGSDALLRQGGDVAVFSIFDKGSIAKLDKRRLKGPLAAQFNHIPALDTLHMSASQFYSIFYWAALRLSKTMDEMPTCTNCMAGMNRSSTAQMMYCILRAYSNPGFESPTADECMAGVGPMFDIDKLMDYHRKMNLIGRYPVLTNPVFVKYLKCAAAFERAIHTSPQLEPWVRLRAMGRMKALAKAFQTFCHKRRVPDPPDVSPVPSVAVVRAGNPSRAAPRPNRPSLRRVPILRSVGAMSPFPANGMPQESNVHVGMLDKPFTIRRQDIPPMSLF